MLIDKVWLKFEGLLTERFAKTRLRTLLQSSTGEALRIYLALLCALADGEDRQRLLLRLAERLRLEGRSGAAARLFAVVRAGMVRNRTLALILEAEASAWMDAHYFSRAAECYLLLRGLRPMSEVVAEGLMQALRRSGRGEESLEVALCEFERLGNTPWTAHAVGLSLLKVGETKAAVEFLRECAIHAEWCGNALASYVFSLSYLGQSVLDAWKEVYAKIRRQRLDGSDSEGANQDYGQSCRLERIRVAYVSGDFARNPLARFFLPLVRAHHLDRIEVIGYSCRSTADGVTLEISRCCDQWFSVHDWSDDRLSSHIRALGVHVLIDLGGWSSGGRPTLFSMRSAPVQMTMLGMMQDTGLPCVDYRLGDCWLDSDDGPFARGVEVEQLVRHPMGAVTYLPPEDSGCCDWHGPGVLTFGVVAQLEKVSRDVAGVWANVLRKVPDSRILILGDAGHRLRGWLVEDGIQDFRIECRGRCPGKQYLSSLREMDLILDSFPFTGLTVTLDAAWMGVSTVTLAGRLPFERGGLAVAERIGRPDLVASSVEGFIEIAVSLAEDVEGLRAGRGNLREGVRGAFCDHLAWTEAFEGILVSLVNRHCGARVVLETNDGFQRRDRERMWENALRVGVVSASGACRAASTLESAGLSNAAGRLLEDAMARYPSPEVCLRWCEWRLRRGGVDEVLLSRLESLAGHGGRNVVLRAEGRYRRFGARSAIDLVREEGVEVDNGELSDFLNMIEWGLEAGDAEFSLKWVTAALDRDISLRLLGLIRKMILDRGCDAEGIFAKVVRASDWLGLEPAGRGGHE